MHVILMNATISKGSSNPRSILSEFSHTRTNILLVKSPKARQTQGLSLVNLAKPRTNVFLVNSPKDRQTQGMSLLVLTKPRTNVFLAESSKASQTQGSSLPDSPLDNSNAPKLVSYLTCLTRKPRALVKKLRKVKREAPASEKPKPVRTHLCNMIIVPEINDSTIGVYHDKTFNQVEIKPEMIGHYFTEFSISYKPVKHGMSYQMRRITLVVPRRGQIQFQHNPKQAVCEIQITNSQHNRLMQEGK
ncbi:40S ribosomal protein S15-4 [Glycine soja]|uniref:40S ribosomal protein S15-4 n=1 Tax=Glycine soja TaxID=3848 RepID=A0A445HAP4_GLYSO|nr:40S ribosomal protein S15-4 [Glycine soja]